MFDQSLDSFLDSTIIIAFGVMIGVYILSWVWEYISYNHIRSVKVTIKTDKGTKITRLTPRDTVMFQVAVHILTGEDIEIIEEEE